MENKLNHWDLLSPAEQAMFTSICQAIAAPTNRNKRNKRIDNFKEIIDALTMFIDSSDEDKWKRRLVCGLCYIEDGIAVNISQLKKIVLKCKSSINGSLKGLGFGKIETKASKRNDLYEQIPYLRQMPSEMRCWTIRTRSDDTNSSSEAEDCVITVTAAVPNVEADSEPFQFDIDFDASWISPDYCQDPFNYLDGLSF